jgi:hypothetical protein
MNYEIQNTTLDRLAAAIPDTSPIYMLNLLRFRPDGGRETYLGDYVTAFRAITAARGIEGIEPIWTGDVAGFVAGPEGEAWDAILIVRYPSLAAFRVIVESDQYRHEAAPHRLAALIDWRLIAQTEMTRLG